MGFRFYLVFSIIVLLNSCNSNNNKTLNHENKIEFDFVKIPSGNYILGSDSSVKNPKHIVKYREFYISKNEITNGQFKQFIDETNYITTAEKYRNAKTFRVGLGEFEWIHDSTANWRFPFGVSEGGIENKMNYPVTCISYIDILEFCKWAEVRLPTLDEWEIACRAGSETKYFFGNDSSLINEYANIWVNRTHKEIIKEDQFLFHSPVGTFKPNAWGLYDMYGNNFEFCSTKFSQIKDKDKLACARGGSWWCSKNSCNYFNSVDIGSVNKVASFSNHGFRVVKIN